MNFLFTTVLVLLIVAPGLIFFRTYYAGKFSVQYSKLTLTDQIFQSIIPSFVLHLTVLWIIDRAGWFTVRVDLLGILLMGAKDDRTPQQAFLVMQRDLGLILIHHLLLWVLAGIAGWQLRRAVRHRGWDRKYPSLRYSNFWHYLLTGEVLEMRDIRGNKTLEDAGHLDFIFVDVAVKLQESTMIYSGILSDYELANDGGLRCIYLKEARRKHLNTKLKEAGEEEGMTTDGNPYYEIQGDLLVIPYEQMLNLNFTYYIDQEDATEEGDNPDAGTIEVKAEA